MTRAVFLDRDGTIIEEKEFLSAPEQVALLPGAIRGLTQLRHAGYHLFIVSNQSGVGRGYFTMTEVEKVNQHLCEMLRNAGVTLKKIYVAPEAPGIPSRGRKPSPQFLFDARDEFSLDLSRSYIVGDKLIDLQCGWNAGVKKSLLVRTGYGAEVERNSGSELSSAVIVDDLSQAADWIVAQDAAVQPG